MHATEIDARAERSSAKERLASLPRLSRAATRLAAAMRVFLRLPAEEVWAAIEAIVGREQLAAAIGVVEESRRDGRRRIPLIRAAPTPTRVVP